MYSQYYKVLGIPSGSSTEEIKSAFRKLALKHHPDRGGDEAEFKKINEAYQVIMKNKDVSANSGKSGKSEKHFEIKDLNADEFRSILNLLVYFSNIDGSVSIHERKILGDFIKQHNFKVDLEDFINKTVHRIAKKEHSDFLNTLYKDLDKLNHLSSSDKKKILSLIKIVMHSDGNSSSEEKWMTSIIMAYWEISSDTRKDTHHKEEESVFIFPDEPVLFENLNITTGNLEQLLRKGYTIVGFFKVFSFLVYSQKKISSMWLIPPKKYPFREMIGPTFFTFLFGWWSIWGIFYTISSLFQNIIGGKDITDIIAVNNNIEYSSNWAMKNSGGKKLIAILIILFLGWLYTADDSYSTSPSYSNPPKYTNKTEETETINTYHVEKCGQGKCEFKGTCYPLPENAVCQDPENLQRTDAWRCINDAIEYNGYCKHDSRFLNGVIILKNESYFEGGHQIKINNQGGSSDALVKIVDENTRKGIVTFYVRQGDSFAVEDIKNGTYGIYFKYFDYNNNTLQSRGSQKMERSRVLQSSIEGNYIQYDAWDITIYPVVNGNASTDTISDQDFESI